MNGGTPLRFDPFGPPVRRTEGRRRLALIGAGFFVGAVATHCYDRQALEARKKNKPKGNAVGMAEAMGAVLLTEREYRKLLELGEFDTKTSSWP